MTVVKNKCPIYLYNDNKLCNQYTTYTQHGFSYHCYAEDIQLHLCRSSTWLHHLCMPSRHLDLDEEMSSSVQSCQDKAPGNPYQPITRILTPKSTRILEVMLEDKLTFTTITLVHSCLSMLCNSCYKFLSYQDWTTAMQYCLAFQHDQAPANDPKSPTV